MLQTIGKRVGEAMAILCLVSTVAIAQSQSPTWSHTTQLPPQQELAQVQTQTQARAYPQSRYMTCMADDGKGNCTAAAEGSRPTEVVVGEEMHMGDRMLCTNVGSVIDCQPATNEAATTEAATASNITCTSDDGRGNCIA